MVACFLPTGGAMKKEELKVLQERTWLLMEKQHTKLKPAFCVGSHCCTTVQLFVVIHLIFPCDCQLVG